MSKYKRTFDQIVDMFLATLVKFVAFLLFVAADYLILGMVTWLLQDEIAKFPLVASIFDLTKIALALIAIFIFFVDGLYSAWDMLKLYHPTAQETAQVEATPLEEVKQSAHERLASEPQGNATPQTQPAQDATIHPTIENEARTLTSKSS